jgi:hypothetical protein
MLLLAALPTTISAVVGVLVFGDSQGDTGPTYKVIQDELALHGVAHNVQNAAIGGTLSCGWAANPNAIVKAAQDNGFGAAGPDLVWFTAGGNDLAGDAKYHTCLDAATTASDAKSCLDAANDRLLPCTTTLLENLWATYPNASVGIYNYEVPCMEGDCLAAAEEFLGGSFCARQGAGAISCLVQTLEYWQTIYVDALQRTFSSPPGRFTGMNILGAVQQASGVPGASVGHPATSAGSKCEWMTACVHPTYGTPAATAVGKAMWDLWLKNSSFERSSQA